ncbi:UNVERIFIED_CONTAM: hypothetical protein FKN15_056905 [Acipenser sinensis]
MSQSDPAGNADASQLALCSTCGQPHSPEENHTYSYQEEVDDDIICHICLQPLILPIDTPCGHTYCTVCLTNFLLEKDFCPVDRSPLMLQTCKNSSILVNKLLNKLLVTCPLTEHCSEILQRCDLEPHLKNRCPAASSATIAGLASATTTVGVPHAKVSIAAASATTAGVPSAVASAGVPRTAVSISDASIATTGCRSGGGSISAASVATAGVPHTAASIATAGCMSRGDSISAVSVATASVAMASRASISAVNIAAASVDTSNIFTAGIPRTIVSVGDTLPERGGEHQPTHESPCGEGWT